MIWTGHWSALYHFSSLHPFQPPHPLFYYRALIGRLTRILLMILFLLVTRSAALLRNPLLTARDQLVHRDLWINASVSELRQFWRHLDRLNTLDPRRLARRCLIGKIMKRKRWWNWLMKNILQGLLLSIVKLSFYHGNALAFLFLFFFCVSTCVYCFVTISFGKALKLAEGCR